MSLYALMPGPSPNVSAGVDLAQTFNKLQPRKASEEEERKARIAEKEKVILVDMKQSEHLTLSRNTSFSSLSQDVLDESDIASLSSSLNKLKIQKESQWDVCVEEAMMNYGNLVKPPRSTGRASVQRRGANSRLSRRRGGEDSKTSSFDLDGTERAIEFRFLIGYAGRRYCTKRTLLQICQFRRNLLEEQEWTHRKLDSSGSSGSGPGLPEIPRIGESMFCGSGFSQMGGMMGAYKPALEKWFKDVLAIVSDENPILMDFLWEPLDCSCNRDTLHARLTDLGAINESLNVSGHSVISLGDLSFAEEDE